MFVFNNAKPSGPASSTLQDVSRTAAIFFFFAALLRAAPYLLARRA